MDIHELILTFFKNIEENSIYNEISLQVELGIFLRSHLKDFKVEFERNVKFFGIDKTQVLKKEIDIVIYNDEYKYAIELKNPKNGQVPEQMYSFLLDIAFLEQLKQYGFKKCYALNLTVDKLFWSGKSEKIYSYFRAGKEIKGFIEKPTGINKTHLNFENSYRLKWNEVFLTNKYILLEL